MTLNQLVGGSIPLRPTNKIKGLWINVHNPFLLNIVLSPSSPHVWVFLGPQFLFLSFTMLREPCTGEILNKSVSCPGPQIFAYPARFICQRPYHPHLGGHKAPVGPDPQIFCCHCLLFEVLIENNICCQYVNNLSAKSLAIILFLSLAAFFC